MIFYSSSSSQRLEISAPSIAFNPRKHVLLLRLLRNSSSICYSSIVRPASLVKTPQTSSPTSPTLAGSAKHGWYYFVPYRVLLLDFLIKSIFAVRTDLRFGGPVVSQSHYWGYLMRRQVQGLGMHGREVRMPHGNSRGLLD